MIGPRVRTIALALLLGGTGLTTAQAPTQQDMEQLKRIIEQQQQAIRELTERVQQLEGAKTTAGTPAPAASGAPAPASPPVATATESEPWVIPGVADEAERKMRVAASETKPSHIRDRDNLDDRQEPAPRPGDYTLDPQYRGYIPIPNTVFMVKFNPKPRLDFTLDTRNSGDDFRFVTAKIPLKGSPEYGGGDQFNANGNGSQLRLDMRAPSMPGNFRIYYQNDFFGSDTANFRYRLQHFYGQYHGIVGGFTYGVFEDPDAWPDTVDYEGPNAVVFARRPLLHYTRELDSDWNVTVGVEDPDIYLDTTSQDAASLATHAPDVGFNVRWEPDGVGHVQASSIFRAIGARSTTLGSQTVFGWGLGLSGTWNTTERDTFLAWGVYGQGVGGMGNDTSFLNTDAAFDADGDLQALDYGSILVAYTHRWAPRWRSTGTFGYVRLDNVGGQSQDAYRETLYGSANVVYQLFKRLSIGGEVLYGRREVKDLNSGDVVRFQLGLVYSPFD